MVGWRREEILSLEWAHVDLDGREITLPAELSKNDEGRTIRLADELRELIEAQAKSRPAGCRWVFHRNGRRIRDFRESWLKAAGLEGKVFHDFRRTAVRNMVRSGIPDRVAMQISGHKTPDAFARYNITSGDDLEAAAVRISSSYRAGSLTVSLTAKKQTAEKT